MSLRRRVVSGQDDERRGLVAESKQAQQSSAWALVSVILGLLVIGLVVAVVVLAVNGSSSTASLAMLVMGPSERFASPKPCSFDVAALERELDALGARVRSTAAARGSVAWAEYSAAPETHAGKRVTLRQHDFADGTVRIRSAGLFELGESIVFEPRAAHDWRADRANPLYAPRAFTFDFFAAITIEANDVVLDLRGHTFEQSRVHALQQRFYSHIELANQAFIAGQGPTDFGAEPVRVDGVVVENGRFERSAHHVVHGNGGRRVLLRNLTMANYEVAAVALNGFSDSLLVRVEARGSARTVPALATFNQARQASAFAARIAASLPAASSKRRRLETTRAALVALMRHATDDVRASGKIDRSRHPDAYRLFANDLNINDGNSYSLVLHPLGAAVGPFWSTAPATSERIGVVDSSFASTRARIIEVVALVQPTNETVRGPAGDLLRIVDNIGRLGVVDEATGAYVSNALADVQLALLDAALDIADVGERKQRFGTVTGTREVLRWARGELTLGQLVTDYGFRYWRNGDSMFHVNKVENMLAYVIFNNSK